MHKAFAIAVVMTMPVFSLSGCSEGGNGQATRVVSDSAGVQVVIVRPPAQTDGVRAVEVLEIGVVSGPEELQLVGVVGALRLPDQRIVVANGGTRELRFFDSKGSFLHAVGREGEGPGEYRSLDYIGLLGDTIVVYDGRLLRLSLLDPGGHFLGSLSFSNVVFPYVVGSLDSGKITVWQFYGPEPEGVGVHTSQLQFGTITLPGGRFQGFGVAAATEEAQVNYRGRATRAFRPFSREGDVSSGGNHIYVLESSSNNRIRVLDATGRLVRVIAIDLARRAPTSEDVDRWIESWIEEFPPPSQDVEDWWRFGFREVPPPDSIPLIRSLEVDSGGNVCAEQYPLTWNHAVHYWCFTPEGHFVRGIVLPTGQVRGPHPYWDSQLQITHSHVIGVWADDLGVERVKVFELQSGNPTSQNNGA